ncbi:MAG: YIP1 family protein [Ktedonobacteraceae bacterium]|nr:YIP1 family protein [Ktedonobacteraceae bacterium]
MKQKLDHNPFVSGAEYEAPAPQPLPLDEVLTQLPRQCWLVVGRPSVSVLREVARLAGWGGALVQLALLLIITIGLSYAGHLLPSSAFQTTSSFRAGSLQPFGLLPSPYTAITFVLGSFFIGLGTAYLFSRLSGGKGRFVEHLSLLLLGTIPLVLAGSILLLLPLPKMLAIVPVSLITLLFIYRMFLHVKVIMAVHNLKSTTSTLIVLIIPMLIVLIVLLVFLDGLDLPDFSFGGGKKKSQENQVYRGD